MTTKEIRAQVDEKILEVQKRASSIESTGELLEIREWFVSMLSYIGEREAAVMFEKVNFEKIFEDKKYSIFIEARKETDGKRLPERDADYKARFESSDDKFKFEMATVEHKILYALRERVIRQIDALQQRISIVRREHDSATHN